MTGQSDRRNDRTNRLIVPKKNHRNRYYMTRFIATMMMTLTLMADVDRNRKSVIATPGDF